MTNGGDNSINHHWWPVGLQRYWADKDDQVWFLKKDGKVDKKKFKNKKLGYKRRGHHIDLGDSPWTSTFENIFGEIDNLAPHIVKRLISSYPPKGKRAQDWPRIVLGGFGRRASRQELTNFYNLEKTDEKQLLQLIMSLLIRSPAFRSKSIQYPVSMGFPEDPNIGSSTIQSRYKIAQDIIKNDVPKAKWILLRSIKSEFIFGDGLMDHITNSLTYIKIRGKCMVPLTPRDCIYYFTHDNSPSSFDYNFASLYIDDNTVDHLNSITQVYSKDIVHFRHQQPNLTEYLSVGAHCHLPSGHDSALEELEKLFCKRLHPANKQP